VATVVGVVVSGMVDTGPRSAAALSMPGTTLAARPAVGGAANGSAGLMKLVTPGAAAGAAIAGACTGGATVVAGAGAVINAAVGGAANIPEVAGTGA
jgi:hypothetical protein